MTPKEPTQSNAVRLSDGLGTYLILEQEGNYLNIDARCNLTVLGLTYIFFLGTILLWRRRKKI